MACNSCNSGCSNSIWFPDFVSNSCCNPCCCGSVGSQSSNGCGCSCGCNSCGSVGGTSSGNCTCGCNAYGCGCACD